jgi:hypothetical protein
MTSTHGREGSQRCFWRDVARVITEIGEQAWCNHTDQFMQPWSRTNFQGFIYASNGRLGPDRYNEGVYGAAKSADGGVIL